MGDFMKKNEYLLKLQYDTKQHIRDIYLLTKSVEHKIAELQKSKEKTNKMCYSFEITCYNYNLVEEMQETHEKFIKHFKALTKLIEEVIARKSRDIDYDIKKITSINDLLMAYEIQLNTISKIDLSDIEMLQMNAIKKELYEKYMRIKAEIDRSILVEKYNKMQNRNIFMKSIDNFFLLNEMRGRQKENLFKAIQGIDDYRFKLKEASIPNREYRIIDILADIEVYLNENKLAKKYKNQYSKLNTLKEKINYMFLVDKEDLKGAINSTYKSKYPMPVEKNINKMTRLQKKSIEFLYKGGYIKIYEHVEYKSRMRALVDKIKLLCDNIEREIDK